MASAEEFAQAVAKLERRLGGLPGEREIAEGLRWSESRQALIAFSQEAKAEQERAAAERQAARHARRRRRPMSRPPLRGPRA
jgi:hypothetical protein